MKDVKDFLENKYNEYSASASPKIDFESKKKIVLEGESKIFKNWAEHSTITQEEFLEALEWLCNDPCNGGSTKNRMTREIGLTPTEIVKLNRCYGVEDFCTFRYSNGELWDGALWERMPETEKEKKFFGDKPVSERHKISISCKDWV